MPLGIVVLSQKVDGVAVDDESQVLRYLGHLFEDFAQGINSGFRISVWRNIVRQNYFFDGIKEENK
jgi:lipopolysaccharide biosynthesis protein